MPSIDKGLDRALIKAARKGDSEKVRTLLAQGADVNARALMEGLTALIRATWGGHLDTAELLVNEGADVNAKDNAGRCSLLVAANQGHTDIVRLLLENNADVNAKDKIGMTPLIGAADEGHLEIVKVLLAEGADANARLETKGLTEIWESGEGHAEIIRVSRTIFYIASEVPDGNTALMAAAEKGHTEIVQALLDSGADVNAKDAEGLTALDRAALKSRTNVVELLKQASAQHGNEHLVQTIKSISPSDIFIINLLSNGSIAVIGVLWMVAVVLGVFVFKLEERLGSFFVVVLFVSAFFALGAGKALGGFVERRMVAALALKKSPLEKMDATIKRIRRLFLLIPVGSIAALVMIPIHAAAPYETPMWWLAVAVWCACFVAIWFVSGIGSALWVDKARHIMGLKPLYVRYISLILILFPFLTPLPFWFMAWYTLKKLRHYRKKILSEESYGEANPSSDIEHEDWDS